MIDTLYSTESIHTADAPAWLTRGRVPGLDALRAGSIILVLAAHSIRAAYFEPRWLHSGPLGFAGVDVFFVISGFLITLLLCREKSRTGDISLKGFYYRRALRILPAYFVFLAALFVAMRIGWEHVAREDWIAALTYTMNWRSDPAWAIGHIWSLSAEEQFYFLWPPLMMLLSHKSARRLLLACIVAGPFYRVAMRVLVAKIPLLHPHDALYSTSFPARLEPIAAGCLLALLAIHPGSRRFLNRWCTARAAAIALAILAGCVAVSSYARIVGLVFRPTVSACAIPIILWFCANARGTLARILAWRPAVALGVLSYSIYLWQQPFLSQEHPGFRLFRFPIGIGFALGAGILSYLIVERPFLKLKDRQAGRTSPAPAVLTAAFRTDVHPANAGELLTAS
ncbi:MAG TPA: acyltransferase [Tepidisphaeraceae bacterium]|nr:acyltransferase [Tepidisphaeraceae bacterium]